MRRLRRIAYWALVMPSLGCNIDLERSSPVHTDLTGTWPVAFTDLRLESGEVCSLTGLTLVLRQSDGREVSGGSYTAAFTGTHTPVAAVCDGVSAEVPAGELSGRLRDSYVDITLSAGRRLSGRIVRPTLSWTLVELRGDIAWDVPGLGTMTGQWQAGPIETTSRP